MAKIYTRQGDAGFTRLLGGEEVPKSHPQVEAYGTVDELTALIGVAATGAPPELGERLVWIQERLFAVGTILAQADLTSKQAFRLDPASTVQLEEGSTS